MLCGMQSASSTIWTRVAVSIFYDDNHCTMGISKHLMYKIIASFPLSFFLSFLCLVCSFLPSQSKHYLSEVMTEYNIRKQAFLSYWWEAVTFDHMYPSLIPLSLQILVFAKGLEDWGSIPGPVIPKTQKMVHDAVLLNTQHYKVRIKGKVEQSREKSSALPYTSV